MKTDGRKADHKVMNQNFDGISVQEIHISESVKYLNFYFYESVNETRFKANY